MLTRQRSQSSGHLTMQRSGFYKYACTFILRYSIGIRTFTTIYSVQYPVSVPCPSHTCHTTPAHMQSYAFVHVYIYKRAHSNNMHMHNKILLYAKWHILRANWQLQDFEFDFVAYRLLYIDPMPYIPIIHPKSFTQSVVVATALPLQPTLTGT